MASKSFQDKSFQDKNTGRQDQPIAEPLEPNSEDAELAIVGSILINPQALLEVRPILKESDFYYVRPRTVFSVLLRMDAAHLDIDNLTVAEELRSSGDLDNLGGPAFITYLMNNTPTHVHAGTYAEIVRRASLRRSLLRLAAYIAKVSIDTEKDIQEVYEAVRARYADALREVTNTRTLSGGDAMSRVYQNFAIYKERGADDLALKSGIAALDDTLVGFRPGLYAIGGAPSMGKSTFAALLCRSFAQEAPGLLVPTEMAAENVLEKMTTDLAGINYKEFLRGKIVGDKESKFLEAYNSMASRAGNIALLDGVCATVPAIEAEILRTGAKWCIIDSGTALAYMSMNAKTHNLYETTTQLAQAFQVLARMGLVVIVLWQVGRAIIERKDRRPGLHDFKQTGAIEETADVCLALYRHDYYVHRNMAEPNTAYPEGTARIIVLKDRAGGGGEEIEVDYVPGKTAFTGGILLDTRASNRGWRRGPSGQGGQQMRLTEGQ